MALQTVYDSKTEKREACQCKCCFKKGGWGSWFSFTNWTRFMPSDLSPENVTRVWSEKRRLLNWIMLKVHKKLGGREKVDSKI